MTIKVEIKGNLTKTPELKFTQNSKAVLNLDIASNKRIKNQTTGEWENDGETIYIQATLWENQADAMANLNLQKGTRVIATGELVKRSWQTNDGKSGESLELIYPTVGVIPRTQNQQPQQPQPQWGNQAQQQGNGWNQQQTTQPPF